MSIFKKCRAPCSAPLARERLQILLATDRAARSEGDLLAVLREEIVAAVSKHVRAEQRNVHIKIGGGLVPILAIEVEIPNASTWATAGGPARSHDRAPPLA